jgi:prephenate dehydrogenase
MIDQKIAIVGGTGKFGQHLGEKLEDKNQIHISGKTVEKAQKVAETRGWEAGENTEIVEDADVVLVAVPIAVTVETIHEIGDKVPEDALFCDITSVKKNPVEAMSRYCDEVLGMHPMYAPSNSISGQKVVLTPEKGHKWTEFEEFWKDHGADIHITDPESHDKAMGLVQGLMHFSELVVAETIRKSDISGDEMGEYSSPVYQLITDLTARMLNQKPDLYGSIQANNPENVEIRQEFIESAEEIRDLIGDEKKFSEKFEELGEEFDLDQPREEPMK